jgi:hypothetical protein
MKYRHFPNGIISDVGQAEFDMSSLFTNPQQKLSALMPRQDIAKISAALSGLLSLSLESLEFGEPPGNFQVGGPLASITGRMSNGKIVFRVEAMLDQWVDMVNVELALMKN